MASVKDELAKSSTLSSRAGLPRPPAESISDDEMTNIVSSKSFSNVLPAAGRPASQPPPSLRGTGRLPPSVRPPPSSNVRPPPASSRALADDDDDDDGRTAVRGAPKIVKRSTGRAAGGGKIAPASVIKATLESARANQSRREVLLAETPSDLRNDSDDRLGATESFRPDPVPFVRSGQPLPLESAPPSVTPATGYGPPSSRPSVPPGASSGPLPTMPFQSAPYAVHPSANMPLSYSQPVPSQPMSQPVPQPMPSSRSAYPPAAFTPRGNVPIAPASVPAHFMTPPPSRYPDPPGTAVTGAHRVSGRPAASWAVALLACGLFVGVAAVAMTQGSELAADTTASFVDPSRGAARAAAAPQAPAASAHGGVLGASPVQEPAPVAAAPVATTSAPAAVPGVFGASAPSAAPSAAIPAAGVLGGFAPIAAAPAPVASASAAPPAAHATPAAVAAAKAPEPKAAPKAVWHPAPRPAAPAAKVAANDDAPAAKEPAASKKHAPAAADDETKKALEALQKAQLESSNSFGN